MTSIRFVDQTLRDGHQSLWGMRMQPGWATAVAGAIDRAGYQVVDCTGGNQFAVQLRHVHQDPWEGLDMMRRNISRTPLRAGKRWNSVGQFSRSPDAIVDLFNLNLIKHGIRSFWLYDCLFNMDPWKRACRVIHDAGAEVLPAIMFGESPVLTDEFYAQKVREIVDWGFVDGIYFEDAAGILLPERAATLIPAMIEAAQGLPIEMHCHNTTGLAPLNYFEGIKHGITTLHTASQPMANGPSLPSIEATVASLRALGYDPQIDEALLPEISQHFYRLAEQEDLPTGVVNEYDARVYQHQLPGGMTGTFKAQLVQHGLEDRLPDVLNEIGRVREELGYPISATPFSQIVGIQSLLNVTTGERYSVVPDEVVIYAAGQLGPTLAPIAPDVMDRIMSAPRAAELAEREFHNPSLDELRGHYGRDLSDEELLNRYLAPPEDLAQVISPDPDYTFRENTPQELIARAMTIEKSNYLHLEQEGFALTLSRRS